MTAPSRPPAGTSVPLRIEPVRDRADLRRFLQMTQTTYSGDPTWVQPLLFERLDHLDSRKNPFLEGIDIAYWTAWRGERPVGRISAQVNRKHLERHDDGTGHFGFIEADDDPEAWAGLFETAEAWLRQRGMRRVAGPFNPSINDECGLLIDGFDTPPCVMMAHGRRWYPERLKALGYDKLKDVYAYRIDLGGGWTAAMERISGRAGRTENIRARSLDMRRFTDEIRCVCDIFNDAWSDNWGFIPFSDREAQYLAKSVRPIVQAESFAIAEVDGEPAAMMMMLPNLNEAIRDLDGRLLPLGWAKLLWRLKVAGVKSARVPLMGVRKKYQSTALGGALAFACISRIGNHYVKRGVKWAELSWILEDNAPMNKIARVSGAKRYKTYRIYGKDLT